MSTIPLSIVTKLGLGSLNWLYLIKFIPVFDFGLKYL